MILSHLEPVRDNRGKLTMDSQTQSSIHRFLLFRFFPIWQQWEVIKVSQKHHHYYSGLATSGTCQAVIVLL